MDAIVSDRRYFKLTRLYLYIVGIWPYQSKHSQYILRTLVYIVMISCIMAQITYVACFFNMETLTNKLFAISMSTVSLMKHGICSAKSSKFKVLLDGMVKDLKADRTQEERDVMTPYINRAISMSIAYTYGTASMAVIFLQMPLLSFIADILVPLNASRPRTNLLELHYYFVEPDEHFIWTTLHVDISVLIIMSAAIGCDTFYIYTVLHACGLFETAGYRFKCAVRDISDKREIPETSKETYRKICRCIEAHSRAIKYVREIDNFFHGMFFFAVGITVIGISSSLFWLSKLKPSVEFYMHLTSFVTELWHLLFLTFMGHFVINQTDTMYNEIYEGQWYNSVPKAQALYIIALRTALDPPEITAGGVISMNLQTFAQVVKLSFSYFTMLQSV